MWQSTQYAHDMVWPGTPSLALLLQDGSEDDVKLHAGLLGYIRVSSSTFYWLSTDRIAAIHAFTVNATATLGLEYVGGWTTSYLPTEVEYPNTTHEIRIIYKYLTPLTTKSSHLSYTFRVRISLSILLSPAS